MNTLNIKKLIWRKYSDYTNSSVEWLGDVPSHWEIKKLKFISKIITGGTPPKVNELNYSPDGLPWVKPDDFHNDLVNYDTKEKISNEGLEYIDVIPAHSILLSCIGEIKSTFTIRVVTTNQQINAVIPNDSVIVNKFLYYLISSSKNELKNRQNKTVVPILNKFNLENIAYPVPPIIEQVHIIKFLDKETSKIDNLIEKKQRLIKLLQEKRQALITNAVTKGLDPNAPMKDSGIPWLGEVPEHWDVKRLRFMLDMNPGKSELTGISEELQVSFLPMEAVSEDGDIELDRHKPLSEVFSGYTYFKDRDVILAKITPCFENGKGALVDNLMNSIGFGSTEFHVLRSKQDKLDEKYLYYIIKSHAFMNIGESMMTGAAGQKRVPEDFIKNFKIGLPPYLEQKTIVKKLEKKLSNIRALTEKLQTQINKIQEYRQALITAAVTGKIDVREKVIS